MSEAGKKLKKASKKHKRNQDKTSKHLDKYKDSTPDTNDGEFKYKKSSKEAKSSNMLSD